MRASATGVEEDVGGPHRVIRSVRNERGSMLISRDIIGYTVSLAIGIMLTVFIAREYNVYTAAQAQRSAYDQIATFRHRTIAEAESRLTPCLPPKDALGQSNTAAPHFVVLYGRSDRTGDAVGYEYDSTAHSIQRYTSTKPIGPWTAVGNPETGITVWNARSVLASALGNSSSPDYMPIFATAPTDYSIDYGYGTACAGGNAFVDVTVGNAISTLEWDLYPGVFPMVNVTYVEGTFTPPLLPTPTPSPVPTATPVPAPTATPTPSGPVPTPTATPISLQALYVCDPHSPAASYGVALGPDPDGIHEDLSNGTVCPAAPTPTATPAGPTTVDVYQSVTNGIVSTDKGTGQSGTAVNKVRITFEPKIQFTVPTSGVYDISMYGTASGGSIGVLSTDYSTTPYTQDYMAPNAPTNVGSSWDQAASFDGINYTYDAGWLPTALYAGVPPPGNLPTPNYGFYQVLYPQCIGPDHNHVTSSDCPNTAFAFVVAPANLTAGVTYTVAADGSASNVSTYDGNAVLWPLGASCQSAGEVNGGQVLPLSCLTSLYSQVDVRPHDPDEDGEPWW